MNLIGKAINWKKLPALQKGFQGPWIYPPFFQFLCFSINNFTIFCLQNHKKFITSFLFHKYLL